jgi:REP element-mobilizing transposase RayT
MRQTGFSFLKNYTKEFGGSLLIGKRKARRPLSTKSPIHLILKSSGNKIFHPGNTDMNSIVRSDAKRFGIKIYDLAVNWTHIHLLVKIPSREAYNQFIRSVTAKLVIYFSKKAGWSLKGLFNLRPFTKIISWGRQFKNGLQYMIKNQIQAFSVKNHARQNLEQISPVAAKQIPRRQN